MGTQRSQTTLSVKTWLLLYLKMCSILNGLTTYFGEAIVCHGAGDKQKIMEQYCYMHGSYDLKQSSGKWNENCFKSSEENEVRTMYICIINGWSLHWLCQ